LWKIIIQNKGFAGITPTPNPAPNANGSYTVKLNAAEWQIFQNNQNKPAVPVQAEPAAAPAGDNISVAQDASGKFVLQIPAALWKIIIQNKGFAGITPTPNPAPNANGSYTVKLNAAEWQIFQDNQKKPAEAVAEGVNITRDSSGNYVLKFHKQHYETLKSNGGFEGITTQPKEAGGIFMLCLSEAEMKQFNDNQEKINQEGDDSISVSLQASGDYMLHIPAPLWKMIMLSNGFAGITLSPTPVPSADGSYNVNLSPAEWNIFQENQAKASGQAKDSPPSENEISVSIDDGGNYVLVLTAGQYKMVQSSFAGINVKPTTDSSGKMTFRLSEAQWQQFQANQAKAASSQGQPDELSADGGMDVGKVKIPDFDKQTEKQQREVGKLNVEGLSEQSQPQPKEQRNVGKLGSVEFQKKDEAAPKSVKKVGKLNNPFEKQGQSSAAPSSRRGPGKVSSRFGNKFGGSGLQNDGGSETLKSSMTESKRAVRGPSRRAPSSNPVKNLEQRKDVSKED